MNKLNIKRILSDIKSIGMPRIFLYHHGVALTAEIEHIEDDDCDVTLITGNMRLRLTHLSDNVKVKSRPDNLIKKCKLCYAIYDNYDNHVIDLYWEEVQRMGKQPYYELKENDIKTIKELYTKCVEIDLGNINFQYYDNGNNDGNIFFYLTEYNSYWELVIKKEKGYRKYFTDIYKIVDGSIEYQYSEDD